MYAYHRWVEGIVTCYSIAHIKVSHLITKKVYSGWDSFRMKFKH